MPPPSIPPPPAAAESPAEPPGRRRGSLSVWKRGSVAAADDWSLRGSLTDGDGVLAARLAAALAPTLGGSLVGVAGAPGAAISQEPTAPAKPIRPKPLGCRMESPSKPPGPKPAHLAGGHPPKPEGRKPSKPPGPKPPGHKPSGAGLPPRLPLPPRAAQLPVAAGSVKDVARQRTIDAMFAATPAGEVPYSPSLQVSVHKPQPTTIVGVTLVLEPTGGDDELGGEIVISQMVREAAGYGAGLRVGDVLLEVRA